MTIQQPAATPTPDIYVGPSAETWTGDTMIGGEDSHGQPAARALAVAPQGVTLVRDMPTMRASSGKVAFAAAGEAFRLVGEAPQRRAITIIATAAGWLCSDQANAQASNGMPLPANTPIPLETAAQLWFKPGAALGEIGFLAEIDQG